MRRSVRRVWRAVVVVVVDGVGASLVVVVGEEERDGRVIPRERRRRWDGS